MPIDDSLFQFQSKIQKLFLVAKDAYCLPRTEKVCFGDSLALFTTADQIVVLCRGLTLSRYIYGTIGLKEKAEIDNF